MAQSFLPIPLDNWNFTLKNSETLAEYDLLSRQNLLYIAFFETSEF